MSTRLYSSETQSDTSVGTPPYSGRFYKLVASYGSDYATYTNTLDGPVTYPSASSWCTLTAGGYAMTFLSFPLQAFTLAGYMYGGARSAENNNAANVCRYTAFIGKLATDGTLTWIGQLSSATANEATTSLSNYSNSGTQVDLANTAFADGDRLAVAWHIRDSTSATMAAGYSYQVNLGRYTFVEVTETLAEYTASSFVPGQRGIARGVGEGILKAVRRRSGIFVPDRPRLWTPQEA
jgi:hypothetical protein